MTALVRAEAASAGAISPKMTNALWLFPHIAKRRAKKCLTYKPAHALPPAYAVWGSCQALATLALIRQNISLVERRRETDSLSPGGRELE